MDWGASVAATHRGAGAAETVVFVDRDGATAATLADCQRDSRKARVLTPSGALETRVFVRLLIPRTGSNVAPDPSWYATIDGKRRTFNVVAEDAGVWEAEAPA